MRKAVVTEWLLSRVVGHDRAAAIVGDLLEVSELRGKLWFWSAFLRIWVSLTWRRPVAWIGACACGILLVELWQYQWRSLSLHHFTPGGQAAPLPLIALLAGIAAPLWFALPYGILRFGLRDRFTQLCCAMFLRTTVTFFF